MNSVSSFTDSRSNANGFLSRKSRWFRHSDADIDDLELEVNDFILENFETKVLSVSKNDARVRSWKKSMTLNFP